MFLILATFLTSAILYKILFEMLIESIKKLPNDANYDEIMESIYVQQMITKGIEQLDKGEFISHDDVKERFREWLK